MVEKFSRKKNYVNTKAFVTKNFKKRVRYKGFPLSLDRHEDIRKDFKYLQDFDFQTLQPHESVVLCEKYGCSEPKHSMELTRNSFWQYVFNGDWNESDSLRICEGLLLDALLEGLFVATDRGILTTYKMGRFDKIPTPVKSCLKQSEIESDVLLLPVKITFTYFSRDEAVSECDFYDTRFANRFLNHQTARHSYADSDSDTSNMTSKFMTVWENNDDINEIQQTYYQSSNAPSSCSSRLSRSSRSSGVKYSTRSHSTAVTAESSLHESIGDTDDSESIFSQPTIKTCSSVLEILPKLSDTSSEMTSTDIMQSPQVPSQSPRVPNIIRIKPINVATPHLKNKVTKRPDFSAYAYSSSESESTLRSSTPESVVSHVHFESKAIRRKPISDQFWVASALSHLNLESENFKDSSPSKQGFYKATPEIKISTIPKLTDLNEHLVYYDEEGESDGDDGNHALVNVKQLCQGLKLSKAYRDMAAGTIMRTKAIPKGEVKTIQSALDKKSVRKVTGKLLFVKYGDSLTRKREETPAVPQIERNNYTIKIPEKLQTYNRRTLRQSEYFKRVVMARLSIRTSKPRLSHITGQQAEDQAKKPSFQTNRLKISHSITRMRQIERKKEIIKSIRPMPRKFRKASEVIERFIRSTHLPKMERRMKNIIKRNQVSRQGWSTRFIQMLEDNSTDSWVRQTRELFQSQLPEDFHSDLIRATTQFVIRKEQVTLSKPWNTITTITISRKLQEN